MKNYYWTMKNGQKINIDDMDINHLRNSLKMIVRSMNNIEAELAKRKAKKQFSEGELMSEDADKAMLYGISPELTCECDEVHTCQQCLMNNF